MRCCHKDCISTDSVHVNAGPTLYIIQMDVSILGNEENYSMFLAHLRDQEVYGQLQDSQVTSNM